jgi:hypothetical protein
MCISYIVIWWTYTLVKVKHSIMSKCMIPNLIILFFEFKGISDIKINVPNVPKYLLFLRYVLVLGSSSF